MGRQEQWDKIEQAYLEMKEQELDQVDMSELWSRIDEKLEQNQEREVLEKKKGYRGIGRKTAVFGMLAAAVLVVAVSVTVMQTSGLFEENGKTNTNSWEQMSDADTDSFDDADTNEDTAKEFAMKKQSTSESNTSVVNKDAYDESDEGQLAKEEVEKGKSKKGREVESSEISEDNLKNADSLLSIEKEDGFYEFSVNVEKYHLQLVEISVNKKEDVLVLAYSDFSSSVQEKLQDEIEDISAYDFYVDSEGVLYMEKENRYYQIYLEEKGDGFDGK